LFANSISKEEKFISTFRMLASKWNKDNAHKQKLRTVYCLRSFDNRRDKENLFSRYRILPCLHSRPSQLRKSFRILFLIRKTKPLSFAIIQNNPKILRKNGQWRTIKVISIIYFVVPAEAKLIFELCIGKKEWWGGGGLFRVPNSYELDFWSGKERRKQRSACSSR